MRVFFGTPLNMVVCVFNIRFFNGRIILMDALNVASMSMDRLSLLYTAHIQRSSSSFSSLFSSIIGTLFLGTQKLASSIFKKWTSFGTFKLSFRLSLSLWIQGPRTAYQFVKKRSIINGGRSSIWCITIWLSHDMVYTIHCIPECKLARHIMQWKFKIWIFNLRTVPIEKNSQILATEATTQNWFSFLSSSNWRIFFQI